MWCYSYFYCALFIIDVVNIVVLMYWWFFIIVVGLIAFKRKEPVFVCLLVVFSLCCCVAVILHDVGGTSQFVESHFVHGTCLLSSFFCWLALFSYMVTYLNAYLIIYLFPKLVRVQFKLLNHYLIKNQAYYIFFFSI